MNEYYNNDFDGKECIYTYSALMKRSLLEWSEMPNKKSMGELGIHNAWNYANGNPFITYNPQITGRGYRAAGWAIVWPGHPFNVAWYDHGSFVIDVWNPRFEKEAKLEEAKKKFHEIFDEKFGNEELVLTPFSSWMQKSFVEKRNAEIKKALRAK